MRGSHKGLSKFKMFNVVGTQLMQQLGSSPKEENTRKQAVINKKHTRGINTGLWQTGHKREDAQGLNTRRRWSNKGRGRENRRQGWVSK